ncbi:MULTISPECIES: 30S ribosome-binding factor RbfA [Eubacterium]|uniref:Ribosome-binding factor A n=1 Tax=Eubacterium ruminantium TaxID=42322 RepID=A0A1T4MEX2_9FIRM|nr:MULTISPECIES: 30S ribosome-binding factor RbfA [Eubacterium]MCR5367867.1 30S ribosome-binding factor RbfA [Eubacterium sp.]SCW47541.1 ribosome-binding factor A [Eubacterium ruminantium]SDM55297.1 ribosome-binding factor A [Eubacterium ruminantium]SJZ65425.1 ribosome-binding factor A [Eubacterium ruminantium]
MRKGNSYRGGRTNSDVQRVLSHIIMYEVKDPRIDPVRTTISKLEVTKDLKFCKIYISVLGDEDKKADCIKGLNSAKGFIRKSLADSLNLRNTPELIFTLDNSIEYGVEMSKKIDEILGTDNNVNDESFDTDDNE